MFSKRHGDLHHIGHSLLENGGNEIHVIKYQIVPYTQDPTFKDILVVADLNASNVASVSKFGVFSPQGEFFYMDNITFVNYGDAGAITSCNDCLSGENMNQGAGTYRFANLTFVNTTKRIVWSETKKDIFWDLDGSLAGIRDSMIVRTFKYNSWPECRNLPVGIYDDSMVCNSGVTIRYLGIDQVSTF